MIDWTEVAERAAAQAATVNDTGLRFGVDEDGDIGTHLETSSARLGAGAYWVTCGRQDPVALAADLEQWAWGREPVGVKEIAADLGVDRDTVNKWRNRDLGFPEPQWETGGRPAWRRSVVHAWGAATGRLPS